MMRNSFVFYRDWWKVLKDLPADKRLQAFEAICNYAFDGIAPQDAIVKAITGLMCSTIDRDNKKFEDKCKKNRKNILKRWDKDNTTVQSGIRPNTTVKNVIRLDTKHTENENENENKESTIVPKKDELSLLSPQSEKYIQFNQWLQTNCPHLLKMQEQITEEQLNSLLLNYESEDVFNTLRNMENYKPITKNNRSVYRTLRNWLSRDNKKKGA